MIKISECKEEIIKNNEINNIFEQKYTEKVNKAKQGKAMKKLALTLKSSFTRLGFGNLKIALGNHKTDTIEHRRREKGS